MYLPATPFCLDECRSFRYFAKEISSIYFGQRYISAWHLMIFGCFISPLPAYRPHFADLYRRLCCTRGRRWSPTSGSDWHATSPRFLAEEEEASDGADLTLLPLIIDSFSIALFHRAGLWGHDTSPRTPFRNFSCSYRHSRQRELPLSYFRILMSCLPLFNFLQPIPWCTYSSIISRQGHDELASRYSELPDAFRGDTYCCERFRATLSGHW
jgi:hypothetical protein